MKKNVAIMVFPEVEVLDFAGPFEVFAVTDELSGHVTFHTFTVAADTTTVRTRNGLQVVPDYTFENCPPPHVLIVPGGIGTRALLNQPAVLEWIGGRAQAAEVVMSVCTGALVLARAGLLDGLRVTTHHECLELLRQLAPRSQVDGTQRFHDNGKVLTAAGISAGIDCSLHLVGRILGADVARRTATYMEYR
ncbi:MAG: DJ-1/PfpI family protein [Verrucomicrobia bacterium]|nr:DJ-1/PfpI family protein [Verrucomicrobiota bacterium]